MALAHSPRHFHPLPSVGHPETWYKRHIEEAEAAGESLAVHSYKIGKYITAALDPKLPWDQKVKFFRHCLKHHCIAPEGADAETTAFCRKLHDVVVRYASMEAHRAAHHAHDAYCLRVEMGETRGAIADEAELLFPAMLGHGGCPEYLTPDVYKDVVSLQDRWV